MRGRIGFILLAAFGLSLLWSGLTSAETTSEQQIRLINLQTSQQQAEKQMQEMMKQYQSMTDDKGTDTSKPEMTEAEAGVSPSSEESPPKEEAPSRFEEYISEQMLDRHIIDQMPQKKPEISERKVEILENNVKRYLSKRIPRTVALDINQFGYDLFERASDGFAPAGNIPVSPRYVIGPGDELRVTVWGSIEGAWEAEVDRDGYLALPKIGMVGVAGLTFQELKSVLAKEFSKYYSDFEMNITLGQLKSFQVYVVGNARKPGAYSMSSQSTILNALFMSGGPSKTGSLRDIQLKRNGRTIVHLDLYEFLLQGDKSDDIRLMPEDVVFIPAVGPMAGIMGNVKKPAIYELKGETRVLDLIQMAGGLPGSTFKGRYKIQRVQAHQARNIVEGDLFEIREKPEKNIVLQDEDVIELYSVDSFTNKLKNVVTVQGAVALPGEEYGIVPRKTKLSEVLSRAGGLVYYASDRAEVTRVHVTPEGPRTEVFTVNLKQALQHDPTHDIPLEINDYVFVYSVPDWHTYQRVVLSGEVKYPGTYTIRKGETLSSLIERAGGFTAKAYLPGAVFRRESVRETQAQQLKAIAMRLERELLAKATSDVGAASSTDEALIMKSEMEMKKEFVRVVREMKPSGRMVVRLEQPGVLKGTPFDIELEDQDALHIPSNPNTVQVAGAVFNQIAFIYEPGRRYSDYIAMCGGYTDNADIKNVFIIKSDGRAVRPSGRFSWRSDSNKWAYGAEGIIQPGDTIVIPDKLSRVAWMREIKDLTQIIFQVATTAGILLAI